MPGIRGQRARVGRMERISLVELRKSHDGADVDFHSPIREQAGGTKAVMDHPEEESQNGHEIVPVFNAGHVCARVRGRRAG